MKAIIIEDEAAAAAALEGMLAEYFPDIKVQSILQSVEESVEWLKDNGMPDMIFMDIHLADGLSFGIFDEIKITSPVVFTTAYDQYALKAFEVNSIDYLLKPISAHDLSRAVEKLKNLSGSNFDHTTLSSLIDELRPEYKNLYRSSFLVAERDKLTPLPVKEIAYIFIEAKIVSAVTFAGTHKILDLTLDEVSSQLDPRQFYRANRQVIISRSAVKDISIWFGGKLAVNLTVSTPERIFISKARVREFKEWLTI